MTDSVLTSERILEAAEEALRRFGPAKATVIDVARALGVSHGSVYRHFPSKAALRDAVAERWLGRMLPPLAQVAEADGPAPARLRRWFDLLMEGKRHKVLADPELFAAYHLLAVEARAVVQSHVASLAAQIACIIAGGQARDEFAAGDPAALAWAVLRATTRFHDPAYAREWSEPGIDAAFEGVWALILAGLMRSDRS